MQPERRATHPDQSGLGTASCGWRSACARSARGTSPRSAFATAVVGPGRWRSTHRDGRTSPARRRRRRWTQRPAARRTRRPRGESTSSRNVMLHDLPEHVDGAESGAGAAGPCPRDLLTRPTRRTVDLLRRIVAFRVRRRLPRGQPAGPAGAWPAAADGEQRMEDARFVRFVDDGRHASNTAPPTPPTTASTIAPAAAAQPGPAARSTSPAARAGGPEQGHGAVPAAGRGPATGAVPHRRRDHRPDQLDRRVALARTGADLSGRAQPWEIIQVGNCGPPIETDARLAGAHPRGRPDAHLRHRRDAARPGRPDPGHRPAAPARCWRPDDAERDGYVPNVVYSLRRRCMHDGRLWMPYGIGDAADRRRLGRAGRTAGRADRG